MRFLILMFLFTPSMSLAEEILLPNRPSSITIFPKGARVVHDIPVTIPAGSHTLILSGLPPERIFPDFLQLEAEGFVLRNHSFGINPIANPSSAVPDAVRLARKNVNRIEDEVFQIHEDTAKHRIAAKAADAQLDLLSRIGGDIGEQMNSDELGSVIDTIGDKARQAGRAKQDAESAMRELQRDLKKLNADLKIANALLKDLAQETGENLRVLADVHSETDIEGRLRLSYLTDGFGWATTYGLHLKMEDKPELTVKRKAVLFNRSPQDMRDVAVTLSTTNPFFQVEASSLSPQRRVVVDPSEQIGLDGVMMETPVIVEEEAARYLEPISVGDGLAFTYQIPFSVDLFSNVDLTVDLGQYTTEATVIAVANPTYDETAFVEATMVNTSGETMLPSSLVWLHLGDALVGSSEMPLLASGARTELPFGPIHGLTIKRTILDRQKGDRGIISRTNQQNTAARIDVENLTGRSWPVRLLDQVPFSEQEELQVDWSAEPAPSHENYDDDRGILAWEFEMAPGAKKTIRLTQKLTWPEGKVLE